MAITFPYEFGEGEGHIQTTEPLLTIMNDVYRYVFISCGYVPRKGIAG
jgi:hypothetical protein